MTATDPQETTTSEPISVPPPEFAPEGSGGKLGWLLAAVGALVAVILVVFLVPGVRDWFTLHTGVQNGGPDPYYNFWSGFGSDIGEATLLTAISVGVYTGVRKANCHTKGCWRIGHHAVDGTPFIVCRHHHPSVPNGGATHEHILLLHHKHKLGK